MGRRIILPTVLALAIPLMFFGCGSGGGSSAGASSPGGASAPATGTISGTVTDSVKAVALPGVEVTATERATGGAVLATGTTDASGWYSLTVPTGGCYVQFSKASYTPAAGMFAIVAVGVTVTMNAQIAEEATGGWNVFNPADFDQLMATKLCLGCRLHGAELSSADLAGANLCSANLTGADLNSANLTGALMSGVYLTGASLTGANLSGTDLSGARMVKANLVNANLANANLTRWADLSGADLTGANLSGADLSPGTKYLSGANLSGADLTGANLSGTIWTDGRVCADNSVGECR